MHCYLVLVCLAVAVTPILSLNCCIPQLVEKIQALNTKGVLEQEKSFGSYRACILSDTDAARFASVKGTYKDDALNVTVIRKVDPVGTVTKQYSFANIEDYSYDQVESVTNESFTVYNIRSTSHYTAKYGCKNSNDCADGSNYVQCAFPSGTETKYYKECQAALDEVVKDYITTTNIC